MKLNNYTHPDESLQKIKLETLTNEKLVRLAKDIRGSWNCGVLEDPDIVINTLANIVREFNNRMIMDEFKFTTHLSLIEGITYTAKLKDSLYEVSWIEDGEKKSEIYKASKVKEYIQNGLWILEGRG